MYDNLFEPVNVGPVTLRNRLVRSGHNTGYPWSDNPKELIAYHAARARGGVSMSILQTGGVLPSASSSVPVYDDSVVAGYQSIMETLAPLGMKLFQQLNHRGSMLRSGPQGGGPWSASDVPSPVHGAVPQPMSQGQIEELVASFAAAAGRAKQGGLEGVEVHAAHGYLIGQFLSPVTNHRTDEFGGSFENRTRLLVGILEAIRSEVGTDFAIGVRLSSDEEISGGLGPEELAAVALHVEPLIDYLSTTLSGYYQVHKVAATMDEPLGYELAKAEVLTRAVQVPTVVTGRIMTLDHASHVVATGQADMVSMVRALIADPDLITKSRDGRSAEVRPCISTNQGCLGGLNVDGRIGCVVNAAAGREAAVALSSRSQRPAPRRVVVVGGGPAGLEAARAAAERGHEVVLLEMRRELGGQVAIAATAPRRADYGAITRWLAEEAQRLGVKIRLATPADPDVVLAESPDVLVIATGSTPRRDGFQSMRPNHTLAGVGLPHVGTSWDLFGFGGRVTVGTNALIWDDAGGYEALAAAEELTVRGANVTFVTHLDFPGARVPHPPMTTRQVRDRLADSDFTFIGGSYLVEITPESVTIGSLASDRRRVVESDTVILVGVNAPNNELAEALAGYGGEMVVVGEAHGAAGLQRAIHESWLAMQAI